MGKFQTEICSFKKGFNTLTSQNLYMTNCSLLLNISFDSHDIMYNITLDIE